MQQKPSSSVWRASMSLLLIMLTTSAVSSFGTTTTSWPCSFLAKCTSRGTYNTMLVTSRQAKLQQQPTTTFVSRGGGGGNSHPTASSSSSLAATSSSSSSTSATTQEAAKSSAVVSKENLNLLSGRGRKALERLVQYDATDGAQQHVYGNWPEPGTDDDGKVRLADQLANLDESYPGGLPAYLTKAKLLLEESAKGLNPFAEFKAKVPEGESLHFFENDKNDAAAASDSSSSSSSSSMSFSEAEQLGLKACHDTVFVLVAGGLGERLGYSGIKLSLETNLCTNKSYLEFYIRYIKAMQYLSRIKTGDNSIRIPLVIMTSGDTDPLTRQLLNDNDYFGMDRDLLTIVTQDKVAALKDSSAGLALEDGDRWTVQTKPHGHGDVHHLLFREGLIDQWESQGKRYVVFLQDTNALVINSVVPALGVSVARGFQMNSICIPRLAGEAAGAITKLEHNTDPNKSLVINVEYNQLDPLLRSQGAGDVPDPATGYSPFPGNANNLVLELSAYAKTLRGEDQGVVLEFVNPKYKDESLRTEFKKPTRLECMMQDIPKLFQKELGASQTNIGFCMFDRWFTFSPAKNALDAGQEAVAAKGTSAAPGTMSSAESDKYIQNQRKLQWAGAHLPVTEKPEDFVMVAGIPVTPGPRIVLCPAFAISQEELRQKIHGDNVKISQRSSLVLEGHHLTIEGLDLDGALVIRTGEDTHVTVKGLKVQNKGWELEELDPNQEYPEHVRIRGYTMAKHETAEFLLYEPGHFVIDETGQVIQQK